MRVGGPPAVVAQWQSTDGSKMSGPHIFIYNTTQESQEGGCARLCVIVNFHKTTKKEAYFQTEEANGLQCSLTMEVLPLKIG